MSTFFWKDKFKKPITGAQALGAANWAVTNGFWSAAAADVEKIYIRKHNLEEGGSEYHLLLEGREEVTTHTDWVAGQEVIGTANGNPIRALKSTAVLTAQQLSDIATWVGNQGVWPGALADIEEIALFRRRGQFFLAAYGELSSSTPPVGKRVTRVEA